MWVEETISPSTSTISATVVVNAVAALQEVDVALGLVAEAEVLPHPHLGGGELADQDLVDELLRRLGGEGAVERDHHELLDPHALR